MSDVITSLDQLESLYGAPVDTSLLKVTDRITPLQHRYVDAAPFVVLATVGAGGVDCSPRGDAGSVARVVDERTVHVPDRRGNNRTDSLRNLVEDARIALLFLVPGIGVTLRINGTALLRTDARLRGSFAVGERVPTCVIEVSVHEVYTQCPKALIRSDLWNVANFRSPGDLPTVGQINEEISAGAFDGAAYDRAYPDRVRETLY